MTKEFRPEVWPLKKLQNAASSILGESTIDIGSGTIVPKMNERVFTMSREELITTIKNSRLQ